MCDDGGALRAEVAELRAEVERLRAWQAGHACQVPVPWWQQQGSDQWPPSQCTCGQTQGCQVHPYPKPTVFSVSPQNLCGGAAGHGTTVAYLPVDVPVINWSPTQGAAGCAPTMIYAVPLS